MAAATLIRNKSTVTGLIGLVSRPKYIPGSPKLIFLAHLNTICAPASIVQKTMLERRISVPKCVLASGSMIQKRFCSSEAEEEDGDGDDGDGKLDYDPNKLVPNEADVETSIRYMKSEAFKATYGDRKVWEVYRRNMKGQHAQRTRNRCFRKGELATGNPCPICRDEYLLLDFRNIELLKQFMTPDQMWVYDYYRTHICRRQQLRLEVAVQKARDVGFLENKRLPLREYHYSEYYPDLERK